MLDRLSVVAFPWGREPPTVEELVRQAREAERLGFSTVNVPMVNAPLRGDHLFSALGNEHILDALVVMTALLGSTSTIPVVSDAIRTELVPRLARENERQGTSTKLACWVYCHVTPGRTLSPEEVDAHFAGY